MADNVAVTAGAGTTIASDERSIGGSNVQIQRVYDIGSSTLVNGQVQISSTAATIVAATETRKRVVLVNRQTVAVWIGIATVTSSNGFRLDPGDSVTLYTTALIQGITAAAYTAVGDAKVQYIEEVSA